MKVLVHHLLLLLLLLHINHLLRSTVHRSHHLLRRHPSDTHHIIHLIIAGHHPRIHHPRVHIIHLPLVHHYVLIAHNLIRLHLIRHHLVHSCVRSDVSLRLTDVALLNHLRIHLRSNHANWANGSLISSVHPRIVNLVLALYHHARILLAHYLRLNISRPLACEILQSINRILNALLLLTDLILLSSAL